MNALNKIFKFANKFYRDGFMQTQVRSGIAYQIQALREKEGLSQTAFAELTGKKQSVISRLEDTEYGKVSIQSLLDIASALNVALLVRFVSYPEFLERTQDMSVARLQPETIFESLKKSIGIPQGQYSGALIGEDRNNKSDDFNQLSPPHKHGLNLNPRSEGQFGAERSRENSLVH